jgi:tetratricopeptide (TPR) repeat protein
MGSPFVSIALGVIANFATDLIKSAAGSQSKKIEEAIQSTANQFLEIEGLVATLRAWMGDARVQEVLDSYVQGEQSQATIPIQELGSRLLEGTQFYLPDHGKAVATKIIFAFLVKIRAVYLSDPTSAGLHIANRLDTQFSVANAQHEELKLLIENLSGPKHSLQRRFDSAVQELNTGNAQIAYSLLKSLLDELESSSLRFPELERGIHAKLGNALSRLGDNEIAAWHLRRAAELDRDDPVRAAINAACADLLLHKSDEAHKRLADIQPGSGTNLFNYWHTKAMGLVALQRFEEAIAIASKPDIGGSEEERFGLLGAVYLHANRYEEAAAAYETASFLKSDVAEWHFGAGEMILMPLVAIQNDDPFAARSKEFIQGLTKAEEHLKRAAELFRKYGRATAALRADEKLALVHCLQERFIEAINLLEPVVRNFPDERQNVINLAFAYTRTQQMSKASGYFFQALSIDHDDNLERLYIQALIQSNQGDRAIQYLSSNTSTPVGDENLSSYLSLVEVLCAKREYMKAENVLANIQLSYPDRAEVLFAVGEFSEAMSKLQEAIAAYERALKNSTGRMEALIRVRYGQLCFRQKNFSRTVELWKPLIRAGGPFSLQDQYAMALYNARNYAEVIRIGTEMRSAGFTMSALFADVISSSYEQLDELESAREWLEYVCDHNENRPEYIMRLAHIYLRLGRREQALNLLSASKAALSNPNDMMGYAKAYSLLGKPQEALGLAFQAAQLERSEEIYAAYVGAFLAAGDDRANRSADQIALFQNILTNFQQLFPGANQIQSFTIDPENPLEGIQKVLTDHSQQVERAITAYKQRQFPFTTFAKALGRDMYEVWLSAIHDPNLPIYCASGTEEEALQAQQLLADTSGLILDLIGLFTLAQLNLLDKLTDIADVYVAQPALDYLHYMQSTRQIGRERGTMGMVRGQFFMTEISAEEVDRINADLNKLTEWVEHSPKIKGFIEPLTKDETPWIKPLGEATLGTLTIAKQRSAVLITDDKVLADLARQTHGISAVNSQSILIYLLGKGSLSVTEYNEAVLKLLEWGYDFIRVGEEQLFFMLDREDFQLTPAVISLFQIFESATADIRSACSAAACLIRRLFSEIIPADVRDPIALHVLNTLTKNHPKEEIKGLIVEFLRAQLSSLSRPQINRLNAFLNGW